MKHASEAKLSPSFGNEFEYISASSVSHFDACLRGFIM
jgi:hypothetical protein